MENEEMTQNEHILALLQSGVSLTPLEALNDERIRSMKLSTRIGEIRKAHPEITICDEFVTTDSGKKVKKYWIPVGQQKLF